MGGEKPATISQWLIGGLGPGGLDSWDPLIERDCYLGVPLQSQTTGPRITHPFTISCSTRFFPRQLHQSGGET